MPQNTHTQNTHSSCPTMFLGTDFYEIGEGGAPLEVPGTLTLSEQLAGSVAGRASGLILVHQHTKVKTRKSAKVGEGVSSLEVPRAFTTSEKLTEHVAERASGLIFYHHHLNLGNRGSVEMQELPNWIDTTLTRGEQQATIDAYKNAPEKLKEAVQEWGKIPDAGLKAATSFLFVDRRWHVNLRGCPRAIFDPQGFVKNNHPQEINGQMPGVQKVTAGNLGEQYYIDTNGAAVYVLSRPHIKLGGMDDATAQAYGGSLGKLLGLKFTGWCTPHDPGGTNEDPIDGLGRFAELQMEKDCLHIEAGSAGVRDGFKRWGRSLFLQASSSEV